MEPQRERNDVYVEQMPSPPHIFNDSLPGFPEEHALGLTVRSASQEFLNHIDWGQTLRIPNDRNWRYEERRDAQRILPFLLLGPTSTIRNEGFLQKQRIAMIMVIRQSRSGETKPLSSILKQAQDSGVVVRPVDIADLQSLIALIPQLVKAINSHIKDFYTQAPKPEVTGLPPSVLVCCDSGNDRSAAVVIAYIMEVLSISFEVAVQFVRGRRFCIALDPPLKILLDTYDGILKAKQDVLRAKEAPECDSRNPGTDHGPMRNIPSTSRRASKRELDFEVDEDSPDVDDLERFLGRSFVPFAD